MLKVRNILQNSFGGGHYYVLLTCDRCGATLPLRVGLHEAEQIYFAYNEIKLPRPMVYDLIGTFMGLSGDVAVVEKIIIKGLSNSRNDAVIHIRSGGVIKEVSCRPVDAIVLSIKNGIPLMPCEEFLHDQSTVDATVLPKESLGMFDELLSKEKYNQAPLH